MSNSLRVLTVALAFATVPLTVHADARSQGQQVFKAQCSLCHDDSARMGQFQGPPLFGVVGRKVGSAKGFDYTPALQQAGAKGTVWDAKRLDAFLTDPQKVYPGTAMPIQVGNAADRKALVTYLASLGGGAAAKPAAPATPKPAAAKPATKPTPVVSPGDWTKDAPGVRHKVTVADLPAPFATPSASNSPDVVEADKAAPKAPDGFTVTVFASGLNRPRQLRVSPTGDLYVGEAGTGQVTVFRNSNGVLNGKGEAFATGLTDPFGIAFAPGYVYLSSPTSVTRYPAGGGAGEALIPDLATGGGHSSRDLIVSPDGKSLYVAVGSGSNVADGLGKPPAGWVAGHATGESWGAEAGRAMVLRFDLDGKNRHVVATGIRNCVGLGFDHGNLYCSVNERDGLGEDLVPDYFSHINDGGFYGWPWYYLGNHADPRQKDMRPDLSGKATVPDLLFASHSAPLGFTFYAAPSGSNHAFPATFNGDAFVALHGSWNRAKRTGSKVVRVFMKDGKPTGEYEDFLTGFVVSDKSVSGRPVGVAVGPDGALYVSDDAGGKIWRVAPN